MSTSEKQEHPLATSKDRAPNGTFLPGHTPLAFGGARPNSGPKPSLKTRLRRFEEEHPDAYDELMEMLYQRGLSGKSEDAQYVLDRIRGRPHQSQDLRVRTEISLTADDYAEIARLAQQSDRLLLGDGNASEQS